MPHCESFRGMTATLHPLPISGLIVKGPDTVHWSRKATEKRAGTDDAGDAVGVAGPKKDPGTAQVAGMEPQVGFK